MCTICAFIGTVEGQFLNLTPGQHNVMAPVTPIDEVTNYMKFEHVFIGDPKCRYFSVDKKKHKRFINIGLGI